MRYQKKHKHILENAEKICDLHRAIKETFSQMPRSMIKGPHHLRSDAWRQACAAFHRRYPILAFTGGLNRFESLKDSTDPALIEDAVTFLEADPVFFRSGYMKEKICHYLKRKKLSDKIVIRIQRIILMKIDSNHGREFRYYCNLAPIVTTLEFKENLTERLSNLDPNIQKRAQWVLMRLS